MVFVASILQISKEMFLLHISNNRCIPQTYQLCIAFFLCWSRKKEHACFALGAAKLTYKEVLQYLTNA